MRAFHRPLAIVLIATLLSIVPTSALASAPSPPSAHSATAAAVVKFAFHAGLAFGAFRYLIYKPYRAGDFTHGSFLHKLAAYVKAGAAALFCYHEVKLALADAKSSKLLSRLVSPLNSLVALFATVVAKVKARDLGGAAGTLKSASSTASSVEHSAASAGASVSEKVPSAAQLLAGVAA